MKNCKRKGCDEPVFCRGLCSKDYQVAHRLVNARETDWETLEKNGKCDPPKRGRRSPTQEWLLGK